MLRSKLSGNRILRQEVERIEVNPSRTGHRLVNLCPVAKTCRPGRYLATLVREREAGADDEDDVWPRVRVPADWLA